MRWASVWAFALTSILFNITFYICCLIIPPLQLIPPSPPPLIPKVSSLSMGVILPRPYHRPTLVLVALHHPQSISISYHTTNVTLLYLNLKPNSSLKLKIYLRIKGLYPHEICPLNQNFSLVNED